MSVVAAGPGSLSVPWIPLLALVLAASLIRPCRSRRAAVVLLVALLGGFAFEGGVHSVHHLGDEDAATQCAMASASSSLSGAGGSPVELVAPVEAETVAWQLEPTAPSQRFAHPAQGRAPPVLA
jgi:hypothetical protein